MLGKLDYINFMIFFKNTVVVLILAVLAPKTLAQDVFPAQLELGNLNGTNGFSIRANFNSGAGSVAIIGDINNDGIDDFIVAHPFGGPSDNSSVGGGYVVFGKPGGFDPALVLRLGNGDVILDGTDGFVIYGVSTGDTLGIASSAAGDINGDGVDDLIISAIFSDVGVKRSAGTSYVVFGHAGQFAPVLELSDLDGSNGFSMPGTTSRGISGRSVSAAGDINNDGFDDLIIGGPDADPGGIIDAGTSYVVFGHSGNFQAQVPLEKLDGKNGFAMHGFKDDGRAGFSVSGAGDVNGDDIDDVIIGAPTLNFAQVGEPGVGTGNTYVVFGHEGNFPTSLELSALDGSNGFTIPGFSLKDVLGRSVSAAGDINNDGIDDVIIGAAGGDPVGRPEAGQSFVIFGKTSPFAPGLDVSTLDGNNGFTINGRVENDNSGFKVSGVGDVNGDGIDDLLVTALAADPDGKTDAGQAYIIFGHAGSFSATFELTSLDGNNGFVLNGAVGDVTGNTARGTGDINGDGVNDLILGNASNLSGYVVFGRSTIAPETTLFSSTLPTARSGFLGGPAITVFASAVNAGASRAQNCKLILPGTLPVTFNYQLTNASNVPTGPQNALFGIDPGAVNSFILSFTPTATSNGVSVFPNFVCDNANVAAISGVNTVFLSIANAPVPDILSIGATPDANGIITVPAGGISFMTASTTNIGVGDAGGSADVAVTVTADTGSATLPLLLQLCETDAVGSCITPLGTGSVNTTIGVGPSFFAVFVSDQASGGVPLDPANARVFLRFTDAAGTVRSVTSAAVTVQ